MLVIHAYNCIMLLKLTCYSWSKVTV